MITQINNSKHKATTQMNNFSKHKVNSRINNSLKHNVTTQNNTPSKHNPELQLNKANSSDTKAAFFGFTFIYCRWVCFLQNLW